MSAVASGSESHKWRFLFSRYFQAEFMERFCWFLQEQHGPIRSESVSKPFAGTTELHSFVGEPDLTVTCEFTLYELGATSMCASIGVNVCYAFHHDNRLEQKTRVVNALDNSPRLEGLFQGMRYAAEDWVQQTSGNVSVIFSAGPSEKIIVGKNKIFFLHGALCNRKSTFMGTYMCTWNPQLKMDMVLRDDKEGVVEHVEEAILRVERLRNVVGAAAGIFEVDPLRLFRSMQYYYKPRFLVFMAGIHRRSSSKAVHCNLSNEIGRKILLLTIPKVVSAQDLQSFFSRILSE